MMNNNSTPKVGYFPWLIMLLMSSVTFVGILSELIPSGILPLISDELHLTDLQGGNLVGYYAIASAIFAIPLISATMHHNRKYLLLALLLGFAVSNIVVAMVSNYYVIITMRVIGGICAGVMWPMIAAYGMRLVDPGQYGKAVAVIMAGNTLGVSVGMPLITWVGNQYGWRSEFMTLGVFIGLIAVLSFFLLPSVNGERLTRETSPFAMLKIKPVLVVLLFTFLGVCAHYGAYVYITRLVDEIGIAGGIDLALVMFGIGSLVSVVAAVRYTDRHLQLLTVLMFALLIAAMGIFLIFGGMKGLSHFAFLLWGLSFGPLVTLFQTAVGRHVPTSKDIATSIQSCTFNLSIMIAASACGLLLTPFGAMSLPAMSIILSVPGLLLALFATKTLSHKETDA